MTEDEGKTASIAKSMLEMLFRAQIEYGSIAIGVRSSDEIIDEFSENLREIYQPSEMTDWTFEPIIDHRDSLLERARIEAAEKREEIAITLFATWLEHFINGLLYLALSKLNLEPSQFKALIRELRLPTKATALWKLAGLSPLNESEVRLIERVGHLRNAFVHYKWTTPGAEAYDQQERSIRQAIDELEHLITRLREIEDEAIWQGRRNELQAAFREHLRKLEEDIGPFSF